MSFKPIKKKISYFINKIKKFIKKYLYLSKILNRRHIDKKYIFYHVPRCSGTFLKNIINKYFGNLYEKNSWTKIEKEELGNEEFIFGHRIYTDLKNFENTEQLKGFTILRNPHDLYLSKYFVAKKNTNSYINQKDLSFEQFLEINLSLSCDNIITRIFSDKLIHPFGWDKFKIPENYERIKKSSEKKIKSLELKNSDYELAYSNLKSINIFKFKNFESIFKFLKIDFINNKFDNLHKNSSGTKYDVELSINEKILLDKTIFYDQQIYNQIFNN